MKVSIKRIVLVVAALLPMVAMVACSNLLPQVKEGVTVAEKVSKDAQATIDATQAAIDKLPVGDPVRVQLESKLAQAIRVKAEADKYIKTASGVIKDLESGTISPETATAVSLLPYGSYAIAALSILLAVQKHVKASGLVKELDALKADADPENLDGSDAGAVVNVQGEFAKLFNDEQALKDASKTPQL